MTPETNVALNQSQTDARRRMIDERRRALAETWLERSAGVEDPALLRAVRSARWKWIEANEGNPRGVPPLELFDVASDPTEQRNLVEREPGTVAESEQAVRALLGELRRDLAVYRTISEARLRTNAIDSASS